jgi:hypothetical protein
MKKLFKFIVFIAVIGIMLPRRNNEEGKSCKETFNEEDIYS